MVDSRLRMADAVRGVRGYWVQRPVMLSEAGPTPRRRVDLIDPAADLQQLADKVLAQAAENGSQRASRARVHSVDGLRQTAIAMTGGAALLSDHRLGAGSVHVLRGHAQLVAGEQTLDLKAGDCAPLPSGPHTIRGATETVILRSIPVGPY